MEEYSDRAEAPRDGTPILVKVFDDEVTIVRWYDSPEHPDGGYFGDLVQAWEQDYWTKWKLAA